MSPKVTTRASRNGATGPDRTTRQDRSPGTQGRAQGLSRAQLPARESGRRAHKAAPDGRSELFWIFNLMLTIKMHGVRRWTDRLSSDARRSDFRR